LSKSKEILLLILSDFLSVNLAYSVYYYLRVNTGWIIYANPPSYFTPMIVIYVYWFIIFGLSGLYHHWYLQSRFDEIVSVIKTVFIGCLILFFAIFIDDFLRDAKVISRFLILIYWFILILFASSGRILIRSFQMQLVQKGIGTKNAVIVGSGKKALELLDMIKMYPKLGYKFIGFIGLSSSKNDNVTNNLGNISDLKSIIKNEKIEIVLVASGQKDKNVLLDTLNFCTGENVAVKIMPELYEVITGMAKTQQIYGVPLIEVKSEINSFSSKLLKRIIDISLSLFVLCLLSPILLLLIVLIKLTSKGPIFYTQKRLGKYEEIFKIIKFRTMVQSVDTETSSIWDEIDNSKVTPIGRFMRKTRLDEIPQFINVLRNDMSIVGPRSERPFFVEQIKKEIPYYSRKFTVKPGITGWAQVKHSFNTSIDDVKTKLQYDFYYIENMSISLDFRIMFNTLLVVFTMKGH
jgi:exopolysaccharide biosynthesis polyprenyl glycosylphosphotransferase